MLAASIFLSGGNGRRAYNDDNFPDYTTLHYQTSQLVV